MATSKMIYVKSRVQDYYGLAGFHYEYNKIYANNDDVAIVGNRVYAGSVYFEFKNSYKNELITKQEYQEATGDYSCDDVELPSGPSDEVYPDTGKFKELAEHLSEKMNENCKNSATKAEASFGLITGFVLLLVVLLCAN